MSVRQLLMVALAALLGLALMIGPASAAHIQQTRTALTGEAEVPGPGDPNGHGKIKLDINTITGQICFEARFGAIDPPTSGHIHEAPAGVAGPVVVTLFPTEGSDAFGGCVFADPELAQDIADNGPNYYVNYHNVAYPDGAIRGQLPPR